MGRIFTLLLAALLALSACRGQREVQGANGTYRIPGQAIVNPDPNLIVLAATDSGCEMTGGTVIDILDSRETDGELELRFTNSSLCPPGWIAERYLVPYDAGY